MNKNELINFLILQGEILNKKELAGDPNEDIFNTYFKHILANELLYMINEGNLDEIINEDITYNDIFQDFLNWSPDDEFDEELTFLIRNSFFRKLNK